MIKNILTISNFTIREALSKKIIVTFFAISTFVLLLFMTIFISLSVEDFAKVSSQGDLSINFANEVLKGLKLIIVAPLFGGGLFLSIFSASSFIPNMLEKGNIDILLAKPISRTEIILGKFLGGVIIVTLNIAYLIIGIWILIIAKFGIWDASILYSILTISFTFSVLYSLIILIGILTQSSIIAMIISYLIFFIISPILNARNSISIFITDKLVNQIIDIFYYIVPKTSELGSITTDLVIGYKIDSYQPFVTSLIFLILNLYLSIIIFNKKDF